ncbi:MAG: hypothetical protein N3F65_00945 [Nitrososphaeria archaeon]|nr:hypothetical protein [Aigarchaeota archaeon]MCX8187163.1 hypothetical protein [Nitrososphaeria archaeon]MDW8021571.1 hypothetical protein [Nitrososphaerota archaeon]
MGERRPDLILGSLAILLALLALSLLIRLERGLLGLILTAIVIIIGFYWFREIKKAIKSGKTVRKYPLEISEEGDVINLTAQVPGPENAVSFEVSGRKLLLRGGMGFKRVIRLPYKVRVLSSSYVNGILHIRLLRENVIQNKEREEYY